MTVERPIYLDHHAHTQLDPRVATVLARAFVDFDANPHSTHVHGEAAKSAVDQARTEIATLVGVEAGEIVFTSGATEANNIALQGLAKRLIAVGTPRVLVGAGEHPSVLEPVRNTSGITVAEIPLTASGTVDLDQLDALLADGVGLVSVAPANHEIGIIQPIGVIAERVRAAGALMHCDLAQCAGRIRTDPSHFDLASLSAHKMYGPTGIGALVVRRKIRRHIHPLVRGGGQEVAVRPGTVPVALAVAFGEACEIAGREMDAETIRLAGLRDRLLENLRVGGGMAVNGAGARLACNANLSFEGVDGEALAMHVRPLVSLSTGSACTATSIEPSHVLTALRLPQLRAEGAIRIGLGRATTEQDVDTAAAAILDAVRALRSTRRCA